MATSTYYLPSQEAIAEANGRVTRSWLLYFQSLTSATPSGGSAPADAGYVLIGANVDLPNGRVVTNTATVTWDLTTPGQIKANAVSVAPINAQYLVAAADATLTAERVATDTATIAWDFGTAGQAKADVVPAGSDGDVQYNNAGVLGGKALQTFGYWSELTNGDPVTPELIFSGGDTIDVWVPTP